MIFLVALVSTALAAPVFVIEDGDEQMDDLIDVLQDKGHSVSRSSDYGFLEYEFTGLEVELSDFDVVFWMDGRFSATVPMPETGQEALLDYVQGGGGVVLFGQNGFNYAAGRHPILEPLIPLRSWSLVDAGAFRTVDESHPLAREFSADDSIEIDGGRLDVGSAVRGETIWVSSSGGADRQGAVAFESGDGQGVQWVLWGNSGNAMWQTPWTDGSVSQLLDNSILWAGQGAPRPNAGGPYVAVAGDTVTFDASASVARGEAEIETYVWVVGDSIWSTEEPVTTFDTADQDGPVDLEVVLMVIDSDGLEASQSTSLRLENAAPVIADLECTLLGFEGDSLDFSASVFDPEIEDTVVVNWAVGDVSAVTGPSAEILFVQDGFYSVVVTAEDDDGDVVSQECDGLVIIENVAPIILGEPAEDVDAGMLYSFVPGVEDPGIEDVHAWSVDGPAGVEVDSDSGVLMWEPTLDDIGLHRLRLFVDDGRDTQVLEWDVTVQWPDLDGDGVGADTDCDDADATLGSVTEDADCDGLNDEWEEEYGLDPADETDALSDADGDGRTALDEYAAGTDPTEYDGPSAPTLLSPEDGAEINEVPAQLVVMDAEAPLGQALTHGFTLAMDPTLETVVSGADEVVGDSDGTTSWTIDIEFVENTWYYWTAWAEDDWTTGLAMEPAHFFVNLINEPPGVPGVSSPVDGSAVGELRLVADVPSDPDLDAVSIVFTLQLPDGSEFNSPPVDGSEASASWAPEGIAVEDGESLCWSAVAVDEHWFEDEDTGLSGESVSEPSETACFVLERTNLAPTSPEFSEPTTALVDSLTPTLVVENGIDPEGRATVHRFQLDVVESFTSEAMQEAEVESGPDGQTAWTAEPLEEDSQVWARVLCSDGEQNSEWVTTQFLVSAENDAPGVPGLLNPADGVSYTDGMALTVTNSVDPEGQSVVYEFRITDLRDHEVAESPTIESGEATTSWVPDGLIDGHYQWSARAMDESGVASDWAESRTIIVGTPDVAEEPSLGATVDDDKAEGCSCGARSAPRGFLALFLGAIVFAYRRKTPRC